jgi:predicted enzyme related to lactoylglutathione lyase
MTHINHAFSGFSVSDLAAAKAFYEEVLGISVREEPGMGMNLVLPGGGNFFVYPKADHVPATYTTLNLVVDNIDAAVDELVGRGVTFERYDGMHQDDKGIARGIAANMGPDIAWFKDPAGNILSVMQEK